MKILKALLFGFAFGSCFIAESFFLLAVFFGEINPGWIRIPLAFTAAGIITAMVILIKDRI